MFRLIFVSKIKETSLPAQENDTARIISTAMPPATYCLSFYYHMRGRTIDTLQVIQISTSNVQNETVIWAKKGNQGNAWINGRVSVMADKESKVIFEGRRGAGFLGDIALDDISVTNGYCEDNLVNTCDFEKDLCNFVHDTTTNYKWLRYKGRKYGPTSGPGTDHTVKY
jgi:hypothetical protein